MKYSLPIIIFLLFQAGTPALAVPIKVRSGEHADFSRLVIELNNQSRWTVENFENNSVLSVFSEGLELDTSEVFKFIPKSRIESVEVSQSENVTKLIVRHSCVCFLRVFETAGHAIVADAVAGYPGRPNELARARAPADTAGNFSPTVNPGPPDPTQLFAETALDRPNVTDENLQFQLNEERLQVDGVVEETDTAELQIHDDATVSLGGHSNYESSKEIADLVSGAQSDLVAQLTRSVEQGILEYSGDTAARLSADADQKEPPADPQENDNQPIVELVADVPVEAMLQGLNSEQLAAETVIDRDSPLSNSPSEEILAECLGEGWLNMADWATDEPFDQQVSRLNSELVGEFDVVNYDVGIRLAKLLIHFGFGTEASNVIEQLPSKTIEADFLAEIATIIDEKPFQPDSSVLLKEDCKVDALPWTLLVPGNEILPGPEQMASLIENFGKLPIALRRILAPRIGQLFLADGNIEMADAIALLVERAPGKHGNLVDLLRARIEMAKGNKAVAIDMLNNLIGANDISAVHATLDLAQSYLNSQAAIPDDFIQDVSVLSSLFEGSPIGNRLLLTEIKLKAGSDALTDALEMYFENSGPDRDAGQYNYQTFVDLFRAAQPDETNSADYLTAVLKFSPLIGTGVEMDTLRMDIAEKLQKIGMSDLSVQILEPMNDRQVPAAKIQAARAELDLSHYQAALTRVEGVPGTEAKEIRAKAMAALDQVIDPREVPNNDESMAWLSNNLELSSSHSNAGIAKLAQYLLEINQSINNSSQSQTASQAPLAAAPRPADDVGYNLSDSTQSGASLSETRTILDRARLSIQAVESALKMIAPI